MFYFDLSSVAMFYLACVLFRNKKYHHTALLLSLICSSFKNVFLLSDDAVTKDVCLVTRK